MSTQEIRRLRERITKLESDFEVQEQSLKQSSQPSKLVITDPPIFTGRDRNINFEEWACKVTLKVQTFPLEGLHVNTKILYIASRTSGDAFDLIKSRLPSGAILSNGTAYQHSSTYRTTQQLLTDLKERYAPTIPDCSIQRTVEVNHDSDGFRGRALIDWAGCNETVVNCGGKSATSEESSVISCAQ